MRRPALVMEWLELRRGFHRSTEAMTLPKRLRASSLTAMACLLALGHPLAAPVQAQVRSDLDGRRTGAVAAQLVGFVEALHLNRTERAAQAELDRICALGNPSLVRSELLKFIANPDPKYASETQIFHKARGIYCRDYASPWLSRVHEHTFGPPPSRRDAIAGLDYNLYEEISREIHPKEIPVYARYDTAALEELFESASPASQAFARLTRRIDAEVAAFRAGKQSGLFSGSGPRRAYEALAASSPSRAELLGAFVALAYAAPKSSKTPAAPPPAPEQGPEFDRLPER